MIDNNSADKWFEMINKFTEITDDSVLSVKEYDDGYRWVNIASENGLKREGKIMSHCVGGYWNNVQRGETRIYSLRDKLNDPHVTIEVTQGYLVQVKGKGNAVPVEKYIPYVLDFLNSNYGSIRNFQCDDLDFSGIFKDDDGVFTYEKPTSSKEKRNRAGKHLMADFGDGWELNVLPNGMHVVGRGEEDGVTFTINGKGLYWLRTNRRLPEKVSKKLIGFLNDNVPALADESDPVYILLQLMMSGIVFKNGKWDYTSDSEVQSFTNGRIDYENGNMWNAVDDSNREWRLGGDFDYEFFFNGVEKNEKFTGRAKRYLDDLIKISEKVNSYLPEPYFKVKS